MWLDDVQWYWNVTTFFGGLASSIGVRVQGAMGGIFVYQLPRMYISGQIKTPSVP
jgi:hypothetical protein